MRRWDISSLALVLALLGCGQDGQGSLGAGESGSTTGSGDFEPTSTDGGTHGSGNGNGSGSDDGTTGGDSGTGTMGDPGTDTGTSTGPGAGDPPAWAFEDVYGLPNLDDDDEDGTPDWDVAPFDADDDLSALVLPGAVLDGIPEGHGVRLRLGSSEGVRVWHEQRPVLGPWEGTSVTEAELSPAGADMTLHVEFADYNAIAPLQIIEIDDSGAELQVAEVELRASPLVLNHHLQPAERFWIVDLGSSNAEFVDGYQAALGDRLTVVPGRSVGWDRWIQDENEFATSTGAGQRRLDVVIDSIRDRGLDSFAEDYLVGPGTIADTWGVPGQETTYDSFGNLETSPPVTVGDVEYPFGRIYYGRKGSTGLHEDLASFLASQKVQAPFEIDTLWLCVGHVDEFSAFIPDPGSDKGFKLLMADVPSAYRLLEGLPADTSLPRYDASHGYATVGELVADKGLFALNKDLQQDYLTPITEQFKTELGLEDSDIILVPSLFEYACSDKVAALIPGMVNLVVANVSGETPMLFVPDPFLRSSGEGRDADPLIADFDARMPDGVETVYLDNWDAYHEALGEVHCGTNVRRTPTGSWWESAMHLLEGG